MSPSARASDREPAWRACSRSTGRINRNNEYEEAEVWDFQLVTGGLVNVNPALEDSAEILGEFFKKDLVSPEHCTDALKAEILQTRRTDLNKELDEGRSHASNFPQVEKLFRVIETETRTVVISNSLVAEDREARIRRLA